MTLSDGPPDADQWLGELAAEAGQRPLVVAFSGGLDSTFLLASLLRAGLGDRVSAVHVDHGLQPDSARWADHCQGVMAALGVSGAVERLRLVPGSNLESRARQARYRALARHVPADGWLVLAHHRDDQAETLLLRLLRGASVRGLSGMRRHQQLDGLTLWRPLLDCSRDWIQARAEHWQLSWVEDPSNRESGPDRNFLRHQVLPALSQRWPAADRLAATAQACEEAATLADDLAGLDAQQALLGDQLSATALLGLSGPRRRNLLAWWLRRQGLQVPDRAWLARLHQQVLLAGEDREPRLGLAQHVCCRFRDRLFLLPESALEPLTGEHQWLPTPGQSLALASATLHARAAPAELMLRPPAQPLTVRAADGGERILLGGMHRQVSELWRERSVPPWQRRRLPLLLLGDEVVAAAAIGVADSWQPAAGETAVGLHIEVH